MDNFIIIISYLLIGILLRYVRQFPKDSSNVLNLFVIYVSLPALIFVNVPKITISKDLFMPALMPWIMLLFSSMIIILLSKIMKWSREVTGALLLLVPLGNTSFLGIPMVKTFFGQDSVIYAILYDQLGSFLILGTYGTFIVAYFGGDTSPSLKGIISRIITFPPFVALCFALLFLRNFQYPNPINTLLSSLAATLVPIVMIAVGFQLNLKLDSKTLSPLCIGLFIKLIISPFLALILCTILGISTKAAKVSIFEAGMPPMISAGAVAIISNLSPKLVAALVGIGIILSFLTLPLLFYFL